MLNHFSLAAAAVPLYLPCQLPPLFTDTQITDEPEIWRSAAKIVPSWLEATEQKLWDLKSLSFKNDTSVKVSPPLTDVQALLWAPTFAHTATTLSPPLLEATDLQSWVEPGSVLVDQLEPESPDI